MLEFPRWKYFLILIVLALSALYALPNVYQKDPSVQITANRGGQIDDALKQRVSAALGEAGVTPKSVEKEGESLIVRLGSLDAQTRANDVLREKAGENYTVALNLASTVPDWLAGLGGKPMVLGLDLVGGVHFALQVDKKAAVDKRFDAFAEDIRTTLRDSRVGYRSVERRGESDIQVTLTNAADADKARVALVKAQPTLTYSGSGERITVSVPQTEMLQIASGAIEQNLTTLRNRVNELGVAEPIIQQQGTNRIIVQLPGVQDVAKAKEILGRTATLEIRMVDDSPTATAALNAGTVPFGLERFNDTDGRPLLLRRQVILTGENLQDAQPGRDQQTQQPTVNLTLDSKGARIFRDVTRDNIGRRMAIVLFEQGKGQVVTAPVIRSEIPGGQVQISGSMSAQEAADVALLLRAGSLAAPMEIIEERTIGPSLGADNIKMGFDSTLYGFIAIAVFMIIYYRLFGVFSTAGLMFNVLLLLAILSMLQATLTLPGIAAIALTLGMAIDANVLINERIREELRAGHSPQQAINLGFDRAWGTILDSNLTTLIVGIALLAFGTGPIRGFAVVHCIGILTSMFSSIVGVRALVNLWYGSRRKLQSIAIGQVWKPKD